MLRAAGPVIAFTAGIAIAVAVMVAVEVAVATLVLTRRRIPATGRRGAATAAGRAAAVTVTARVEPPRGGRGGTCPLENRIVLLDH